MAAPKSIDPTGWLDDQLAEASPDLLRNMVKTLAEAVMSAEADQQCEADYGQRSPERVNSGNGKPARDWIVQLWMVTQAVSRPAMEPQICAPSLRFLLKSSRQAWPGASRGPWWVTPLPVLRMSASPVGALTLVTVA